MREVPKQYMSSYFARHDPRVLLLNPLYAGESIALGEFQKYNAWASTPEIPIKLIFPEPSDNFAVQPRLRTAASGITLQSFWLICCKPGQRIGADPFLPRREQLVPLGSSAPGLFAPGQALLRANGAPALMALSRLARNFHFCRIFTFY